MNCPRILQECAESQDWYDGPITSCRLVRVYCNRVAIRLEMPRHERPNFMRFVCTQSLTGQVHKATLKHFRVSVDCRNK